MHRFVGFAALLALAVLAAALAPPAASRRPPEIVTEEDGQYLHLRLKDDPAAQAWLYRPMLSDDEEEEDEEDAAPSEPTRAPAAKADLIVALHGAGGVPKNFVLPALMEERGAWCLTVAGRQSVETERGTGYLWDGANVSYILAFVEHVLDAYPLDRSRVVVWGHSAGGTMTLATLAAAPKLFAGGLTTAAPATPDSRHKDMRICVFLGTEDPNWRGAGAVRSFAESLLKKRRKGACAFFAVEDLGHELPYDEFLDLGFDWILHGAARGGEAQVKRRPRGHEGDYRFILVRHKGAEAADGVKRSKSAARKILEDVRKALDKGRAYFPFEAARWSEDERTSSGGGGIDAGDLEAIVGAPLDIEAGAVSDILSTPRGMVLVWNPD